MTNENNIWDTIIADVNRWEFLGKGCRYVFLGIK